MKFTDGHWLAREGMNIENPAEVRDVVADENAITVFASCRPVRHRGDTLGGPLITVEYSSPLPDVICVRSFHYKGGVHSGPGFELNGERLNPDIRNSEDSVSLTSGNLCVSIRKGEGWCVDFTYAGKRITGCGNKSTGYITTESGSYIRERLDLGVGECVYGLGERFTPFVKNGQAVDIWNEDGGTSSEQSYKNIPFYITNKGYGVFVNHPEKVSYEIGSECVSKVQFSVPGEYLEYYIIGGAAPREVLKNFTLLTGRPALPPAWSFGLWLTTSFTTSYDEKTVNSFIDGMAQRDIPLHVFHFDCFWMKEYQWCDFEWDRDVFPDPAGMLKRLKDKGLRICVWINPYIGQKSHLFDEGMENGYLVKNKNGGVWQWDRWQPGMALVDFTNPDAVRWFKSKLKRLLDMGVDCFKTDFGERIPTDVVYFDGSDPVKMHNYYTYLYNRTVFDLLVENRGAGEAVLFARSATAGSQKFPVHWGGDCSANYDSMAESLRGGLSLCLSGFGFWSHDISGFERTAPPDVYKRWTAFGLLSSHSRLHGNESYRVPWLFDEEAVDVLRFFTKLKCRLMPYLFGVACEAHNEGIPMMRAMFLEFPDDPACDYLDRQYMLGGSLLVAPVFNKEGEASYYLPEGEWTNFITGKKYSGGQWIQEHHGYMSIPLMARPNSVIAVGGNDRRPDYDYEDGVGFHVFELDDGCAVSAAVYGLAGEKGLEVTVQRSGGILSIAAVNSKKPWKIILRGVHKIEKAEGADFKEGPDGISIIPHTGSGNITVTL